MFEANVCRHFGIGDGLAIRLRVVADGGAPGALWLSRPASEQIRGFSSGLEILRRIGFPHEALHRGEAHAEDADTAWLLEIHVLQ
ncbi:MAG TPA: hypothetical protein VHF46_07455 [Rubrobacteraceae bacterium]|nr:hypothetical protein [Rubrobacteraceae bacterium]